MIGTKARAARIPTRRSSHNLQCLRDTVFDIPGSQHELQSG